VTIVGGGESEERIVETKEEYQERVESELERSEARIEEWHKKLDEAGRETRSEREEQLGVLRQIQDQAYSKLKELETSEEGEWRDIKARLDGILSELRNATANASDKFL
jgi:hypothetical protein